MVILTRQPTVSPPATSAAETVALADLRRLSVRRRPLAWRYVLPRAGALWLVTRLLDALLTVLFTSGTPAQRFWRWYFWDAGRYLYISWSGYAPAVPSRTAYFPMYPLLVHLVSVVVGQQAPALIALLVVSNLGLFAAFVAVGLLAAHEWKDEHRRQVWLPLLGLACSPLAVFLSGGYSDSLFLALVAWTVLAARRGRWRWAALALALAVVTRPFGIALLPLALIEYGSQHRWWWQLRSRAWTRLTRRTVVECSLLVAAPAVTLGAYMTLLWRRYGDALAFMTVEGRFYGHAFRWPWQTVGLAAQQLAQTSLGSWRQTHMLVNVLILGTTALVCALYARKAPLSFTCLSASVVIICLMSPVVSTPGQFAVVSDGRYCYAALPILLQVTAFLARWPRWLIALTLVLSLALQCALTVLVLRGGWLV